MRASACLLSCLFQGLDSESRILTHKFTHRERFLQSLSATWQPPRECKSLIIRVCLDCHGRGRGFESRRPRHFRGFERPSHHSALL